VRGVSSPLGPVARSTTVHEGGAGRVLHISVPVGLVARGVRAMARGVAVGRGSMGTVTKGVRAVGRGGIRTVARGVGAGACSIRIPAAVRISVGSIVVGAVRGRSKGAVRGRSVGGRSIGAVAVSGSVSRGMVSTIVGRGIAAIATVGIGRHHGRLAGVAAHMHLLVIGAPLVVLASVTRSVTSITVAGSIPSVAVAGPISAIPIAAVSAI